MTALILNKNDSFCLVKIIFGVGQNATGYHSGPVLASGADEDPLIG